MLVLLSPSKTMAFEDDVRADKYTMPAFQQEAEELVEQLRSYSPDDIGELMRVNPKLAKLNFDRFQQYDPDFKHNHARQALLAYRGDVYDGIPVSSYTEEDLDFAQQQVRILSGLYGILKPLDLIQPYRLEMSTKLPNKRGANLYEYWKEQLTDYVNHEIQEGGHEAVINLASEEYFKALDKQALTKPVIAPAFKDQKNGSYKTVAIYAKKARGRMTDFIVRNRITDPDAVQGFDVDGYLYHEVLSSPANPVFTR